MIVLKYISDIISQLQKFRDLKTTIGFVPTMGALHKGHISLLKTSKRDCEITICSIFINPTQFNNTVDFKKYPVTIEKDISMLEKNGCDFLFMPDIKEIYPDGIVSKEIFDLGYIETILEGKYRPGHFQGVCQVVKRLLKIIHPTHLFVGQKDYQQCMVIKRLLYLMQANIKLVICPTLREKNGLAMSSRNMRLNTSEQELATKIYMSLMFIKNNLNTTSIITLKNEAQLYLEENKIIVDYVEIANADDLSPAKDNAQNRNLVALIAAFINNVRLIDNVLLLK